MKTTTLIAALTLAASTTHVLAQDAAVTETDDNGTEFFFSLTGSAAFQSSTDLDGTNGEFDVSSFDVDLGVRFVFNDNSNLSLSFGAGTYNYDFDGPGFGASMPWDDIETYDFSLVYTTTVNEEWSMFVGGIASMAAESGAGLSNSLTGGGLIGATHHYSADLKIGGGVAVLSRIDDSMLIVPILSIDWQIDEQWRLTNAQGRFGLSSPAGVELHLDLGNGLTLSGGGAWRNRRFRLDDAGIAPDGVGEDSSFPVWIRLTWQPSPTSELGVFAGTTLGGSLELEDHTGAGLSDLDYDPAAIFGIYGTLRF